MTRTIIIKGMSCNHCVMAVTRALSEIEGISNVRVNLINGEATFDEEKSVNMELLRERIAQAGYELG